MYNRITNCSFTGKSPPKIYSVKFCSKPGFHFKTMNNIQNYAASPSPFIQYESHVSQNIILNAMKNSFGEDEPELFPTGPIKLQDNPVSVSSHQDVFMPKQILPLDFKFPPQIDCLSENQNDATTADLKALLQSWGMLQLFDWFAGKLNSL